VGCPVARGASKDNDYVTMGRTNKVDDHNTPQRELLRALEQDGYIVVPDVLDPMSIERLLLAFESAPPQADGTQHVAVTATTRELATWNALEEFPLIAAAGAHVLGRPYRVSAHGRNPLPGFGQQGLHADWRPRASTEPYYALTAIWMLDDFTIENGSPRVVPGSHRTAQPIPKSLAQPLARHPAEKVVTGRAGSVLIFNGHLWHSGRRNDSKGPRRAIQMGLLASDTLGGPHGSR
jgi:ectoine hydroxylase-related dioxygenase (phytanoyl-CoA dioxygenase family)